MGGSVLFVMLASVLRWRRLLPWLAVPWFVLGPIAVGVAGWWAALVSLPWDRARVVCCGWRYP
ncbi:hypothetical protein [Nocardia sp. NPDC052112]|uniref:hypothetical protein n=1 Tax=Nocardia sp. NPDC052112 TaxID=3155646 RepID=UPI003435D0F0